MKRVKMIACGIALLAVSLNGCKKDDEGSGSGNPYNGKTTAEFNPEITYGTMTDQDGNIYKTVTFTSKSANGASQTWMAENLRTTKYNDGTDIPNVTDDAAWAALETGAYCSYNNTTSPDSIATFGLLYNYYTIDTHKLAPEGWHIPSGEEWLRLIWYNGGTTFGGGRMKEAGTTHWNEPNYMGSNAYGFTALPSGFRYYLGNFDKLGKQAEWWTSDFILFTADSYAVGKDGASAASNTTDKRFGYSIRLVKD